jgi:hypothetical protein
MPVHANFIKKVFNNCEWKFLQRLHSLVSKKCFQGMVLVTANGQIIEITFFKINTADKY